MTEQEEDYTEGRVKYEMDVDRMINEGLGGGRVTMDNGYIGDTAIETLGDAYDKENTEEGLKK
jgi:hypothetical protein